MNAQNSYRSPDKFGHYGLHASVAFLLLKILPRIQPAPWDKIWAIALTILLAVGIEVFEAAREAAPLFPPGWFDKWLMTLDTAYDFAFDFAGILTALMAFYLYPSWVWLLMFAWTAYFFGRFTSWEDFNRRWWDLNPFHYQI